MQNRALITFISVMLLAVSLTACGGGSKKTSLEVTCDEFQKKPKLVRDMVVAPESTFTVTLCTSVTAGFLWTKETEISDGTVVTQIEHQIQAKGVLDTSSKESWTFQSLSAGNSTVHFKYRRPWALDSDHRLWTLDLNVGVK